MKSIENIKILKNSTIKEALKVIGDGAMQIALIVDYEDKLLGTLTDGDIRRGLLEGLDLDSSIESIISTKPVIAKYNDSRQDILKLALSKKLHQIPIIDDSGKVIGIQEIDDLIKVTNKTNMVVLMVGGLGKRLGQLTKNTPKPMLKVGGKPIIENNLELLKIYSRYTLISSN